MSSFLRIFLVVWSVLILGAAIASVIAYVAIRDTGFMNVSVRDRSEGVTVRVPVPVLPIHAVANVVGTFPVRVTWSDSEVGDVGPALQAMLTEIDSAPDATLLTVEDGRDTVTIRKENGLFVVRVDDGWDEVKITLPVRTARKIAWALR